MLAIICALRCEAEPLIEHFKLKSLVQKIPFPIYGEGSLFLAISGVGKLHAAAAVSYLYALTGERPFSGWINVGVGGHPTQEVGKGLLANQVIDQGSLRSFYPSFTWRGVWESDRVYTVDSVEKKFLGTGIYEMEASGFCSSAFALANPECIQCYKVISDNLENPPRKDFDFVKGLIFKNLKQIEELVCAIRSLVLELGSWNALDTPCGPFLDKWRFTQTEFFQLQRLIQRWEALRPSEPILNGQLLQCTSAKEVLKLLDQRLCFP
jgi:adenosylhomocysteine nucleosidase